MSFKPLGEEVEEEEEAPTKVLLRRNPFEVLPEEEDGEDGEDGGWEAKAVRGEGWEARARARRQ